MTTTNENIIDQRGLETLSDETRDECANSLEAVKWLLAMRMLSHGSSDGAMQLWEAMKQSAAAIHDRGNCDGYEFADGSVLGTDANGVNTWEFFGDWLEEFPAEHVERLCRPEPGRDV